MPRIGALILAVLALAGPRPALAQSPADPRDRLPSFMATDEVGLGTPTLDVQEMIQDCRGGDTSPERLAGCREGAFTVLATRGVLGLSAAQGSDLPGSASTLGKRIGDASRLSFGVRVGTTHGALPRVGPGSQGPGEKTTAAVSSVHVTAVGSILDGFSLTPNAGGVLSLDLLAGGYWVGGPETKGFSEEILSWGIGGRLGLIRESFTLPGVSLSYVYRSLGDGKLGSSIDGDRVMAEFETSVHSVRAVAGKDLLGTGVMAGAGEDRYSGFARFTLADAPPGRVVGSASDDLVTTRRVYFLGVSRTYLIAQLSAELGWAGGYDLDGVDSAGSAYDPESRSWFGSLACRLTF